MVPLLVLSTSCGGYSYSYLRGTGIRLFYRLSLKKQVSRSINLISQKPVSGKKNQTSEKIGDEESYLLKNTSVLNNL